MYTIPVGVQNMTQLPATSARMHASRYY